MEYKADRTLVTQVDRDIEAFLVKHIQAAYPQHHVIGEEGANVQTGQPSPYTWVLDPLDGTTAFVRGLPGWGIAIGLLYKLDPVLIECTTFFIERVFNWILLSLNQSGIVFIEFQTV